MEARASLDSELPTSQDTTTVLPTVHQATKKEAAAVLQPLSQSNDEVRADLLESVQFPVVTPPPSTLLGRVLGLPDAAYPMQAWLRVQILPSWRQWVQGWGDIDNTNRMMQHFLESVVPQHDTAELLPRARLTISCDGSARCRRLLEGELTSPLAEFLPRESRQTKFQVVLPEGQPRAVVVLAQGTADETFIYRRKTVAEPLARHGVACILPMAAYYGPRRPNGQRLWYLRTFCELVNQVYASSSEALVLLDWAHKQFPQALLGMSGMSMGAGVAYTVGAIARYDLAVSPLLACHSASVLASGRLEHELALDALTPCAGGPQQTSKEEVKHLVIDTLDAMAAPAVASVVENTERKMGRKHLVFLCGADDGFVVPESGIKTFEHARVQIDPEAELHWTPGGHISSYAGARWLFADVILRSLERVARMYYRPGGCEYLQGCPHLAWDRSKSLRSAL